MKLLLIVLICMPLVSFASDKISVSEMKLEIERSGLAGPNCRENLAKLSDQSTCGALRSFLQGCEMLALDDDEQPTDVANVVQCEE